MIPTTSGRRGLPGPLAVLAARIEPAAALIGLAAVLTALAIGVIVARAPGMLAFAALLSPRGMAMAVAAVAAFAMVVRWPTAAAVVIAAEVYLSLSEVLVRFHGLPSLMQLLAIPLVLAAGLRLGSPARRRALTQPHFVLLLTYALMLLASSIWASDPSLADRGVMEGAKALLIAGLVATLCASPRQFRAVVWTILLTGAVLSTLGIMQVVTGDFSSHVGGFARSKLAQVYGDVFEPRIAGPVGDPNFFAQLLLPLVPLGLFLGWEEHRRRLRGIAFALAGLTVGGIVLTYSLGAALALLLMIGLTFASHRTRMRQAALVALVVAVPTTMLMPTDFVTRIATITQILPGEERSLHLDSSFEERRLLVRTAWDMFSERPLLGVGARNYAVHFDRHAAEVGSEARIYRDPGDPRYPHSLYLEIAAETGVVGLTLFLAIVTFCLVSLEHARRTAGAVSDHYLAGIARALQIGIAGHLVSALFLHGEFQRPLWLLFGLAAALSSLASSRAAATVRA